MKATWIKLRGLGLAALFAVLAGCATAPGAPGGVAGAEWETLGIDQVQRIADVRASMDEMRVVFRDVTIVRLQTGEKKRVDVTSIGPTIVGAQKGGAPAARTTFALSEQRDRLQLLTQDVPNRKAFYRDIPAAELTAGRSFRFPVLEESGQIVEQTFTVQEVLVR